ncbi:hypothetical protein ACFQJD_17165 [Haloplanus sp. GCM10025708]|uniref:hypothetical protein n=1 Tax=Haloferacaceae TaxID=1644056 RepID=UPI00361CBC49
MSSPDRPRLSIRQLLLVVVFLLGICVVLLADVVNATRGFATTAAGVGKLVGTLTALGALWALYDSVFPITG